MPREPHILATITANGFGHAVQTGAVLRALRRRRPGLRLTVQTAIAPARIREIAPAPFELAAADHDFGVVIRSATELDLPATRAAHARLLRDWDGLAEAQAERVRAVGADLVLANVSFLAVEGAARAGVPAAALACLTWSDILRGLFPEGDPARGPLDRMEAAYGLAALFLQPAPSMPTAAPVAPLAIGPISSRGRDRRAEIGARLGLAPGERLVLVALGGMGDAPPVAAWPDDPRLRWLVPDGTPPGPRGATLGALGLDWPDAVASVDAFVGKPGYGSVANVAVHGTPFLFMTRGDWPEEPPLVDWLHRNASAREIPRERLWTGALGGDLEALWAQPARPRLEPTGAEEAAEAILRLLG
jgi:hypothetical protein